MNAYSKIQKSLSLFMFITINIFFYFKYLSKISVVWGNCRQPAVHHLHAASYKIPSYLET